MKLTFPHLGNAYIAVKALLDELGVDYIIPPFNNKKALEIGIKNSPEFACLPLKINIGNIIQAYREGADTVLITGGCGPCRFGYYCEMEREILQDAGYDIGFITIDAPRGISLKEYFSQLLKITNGINIYKIAKAVKNTTEIAILVDQLEKLTFKMRSIEACRGDTDSVYRDFQQEIRLINGAQSIKKYISQTSQKLTNIRCNTGIKPLKVGIVGEIYTTIDSYTSFNLDARLGNMGVEVDRSVTVSNWVVEHMLKKVFHLPRDLKYAEAAKPYLGAMIGGHAQETIGNSIMYSQKGYDGIVQIYPLTCMPEIVAQSILPAVENDYGIPVLTLIIDEMTGEAGYLTRLEAFVDLLNKRREMAASDR
ncbi:MAG: CoA protein activase [Bacillota bacterium]|nr:CoA protein activase [Bacillota bacterium]